MTLLPEEDEGVPNSPLQRIVATELEASPADVLVRSVYFRVFFPQRVQRPFRGRAVVDCYEPHQWRHPPEPDCIQEWERTGE